MNGQEQEQEQGGFCFNCAAKVPQFAPAIPQTQQNYTIQMQNPWPLLVLSSNLDFMRSQPLIRVMYTATPLATITDIRLRRNQINRAKPHPEDRADFEDWFIYLHEFTHLLVLDWTPAKELAKLYLSLCYGFIFQLGSSALPAEEAWKEFTECTSYLNQIEKSIGFVEELFATALALKTMETLTLPGRTWTGFQEELEELKENALVNEEKHFTGFCAAYERTEPIINLMFGKDHLASYIVPILQPVLRVEGEYLRAYDARARLDVILNLLEGVENVDEASRRLQGLNEQDKEDWRHVLDILMKWVEQPISEEEDGIEHVYGGFARRLWNISKGDLKDRSKDFFCCYSWPDITQAIERFQEVFSGGSPLGSGNVIALQQKMYGAKRFLEMYYWGDLSISQVVKDDHVALLCYEGIRQQLVARKGFFCPFNRGRRRCQCSPEGQKFLQQLSHLAFDGLFGPGEWSSPPCLTLR